MKRKTKLITLTSALSLTTLLVACGGGSTTDLISTKTEIAGIGGSGFISSGAITGFGSVFVNGVKFETSPNTLFDIEGTEGTEKDLALGMMVQVNGTINPDGVTGTATKIVYNDELQGSVANFSLAPDGLTATFDVLGISVKIDKTTTYFDPDNGEISITNIVNGNMVELSGSFDDNGTLTATRIERKDSNDQVEIEGTITELSGASFTLRGISVDASEARLEDLPNGLQNGIYVEVEGRFNGRQIIATEVESEELDFNDDNKFEVQGFITDFNNLSDFKIDRIRVNASSAKLSPSNMQLTNNLLVEAEGRIVNGVLQADKIKMRGGEVEIQAFITKVNIANNRFELSPVEGQPSIVITVGPETKYEDDIRDTYNIRLNDLRVGDFIKIEGYQVNGHPNNNNTIFAVEVELSEPDEVEVKSVIQSDPSLNDIKVLGVEFLINGATRFEDDNDNHISQQIFSNLITQNQSWIEVEDKNRDGIADKIEIEAR